jgi:hypothetical protein
MADYITSKIFIRKFIDEFITAHEKHPELIPLSFLSIQKGEVSHGSLEVYVALERVFMKLLPENWFLKQGPNGITSPQDELVWEFIDMQKAFENFVKQGEGNE